LYSLREIPSWNLLLKMKGRRFPKGIPLPKLKQPLKGFIP